MVDLISKCQPFRYLQAALTEPQMPSLPLGKDSNFFISLTYPTLYPPCSSFIVDSGYVFCEGVYNSNVVIQLWTDQHMLEWDCPSRFHSFELLSFTKDAQDAGGLLGSHVTLSTLAQPTAKASSKFFLTKMSFS